MSRHINRLLAAYAGGDISEADAARVREHLRSCQTCRDRLTALKRLSNDLKMTLGHRPQASRAEISSWWQNIASAQTRPEPPRRALIFAPALVIAAVLALPLIATLSGLSPQPVNTSELVELTTVSPGFASNFPAAGLIPLPEQSSQTNTLVATAAPQENAATPAPAPLAPSD